MIRAVALFGAIALEHCADRGKSALWGRSLIWGCQKIVRAHCDADVLKTDLSLGVAADRTPATTKIEFHLNFVATFGFHLRPGDRMAADKIAALAIRDLFQSAGVFREQLVTAHKVSAAIA